MFIGFLRLTLYLPWVTSLKEKRSEIKSIISKTTQKFGVSVAESGLQDYHQSAEIAIAFLAANTKLGDSIMDNMVNYIESSFNSEITDVYREFR